MKILLIEYEPRYLDRIRGYLRRARTVELVVARDGDEGLELYRRSRPDLVLDLVRAAEAPDARRHQGHAGARARRRRSSS